MSPYLYSGVSGTGTFTQSGGTNSVVTIGLEIASNAGGNGTYNLMGGTIPETPEDVGIGPGTFAQTAGSNSPNNLYIGCGSGGTGNYHRPGGTLSLTQGVRRPVRQGRFHAVRRDQPRLQPLPGLQLGQQRNVQSHRRDTFDLDAIRRQRRQRTFQPVGRSQHGRRHVRRLFQLGRRCPVGWDHRHLRQPLPRLQLGQQRHVRPERDRRIDRRRRVRRLRSGRAASFQQTGGTNTAGSLAVGPGNTQQLSGGTLAVGNSERRYVQRRQRHGDPDRQLPGGSHLRHLGKRLGLVGRPGVELAVDCPRRLQRVHRLRFVHDRRIAVHVAGTTLTVPSGKGFGGACTISDLVVCQGAITAAGGNINLGNGLVLSGSGSVNLAAGSLTVNDSASGMSGGTLSAGNEYIGMGGTGVFTHSAGGNTVASALYLGYNSGDSGTYVTNGTLSASNEYVGLGGPGSSRSRAEPTPSAVASSISATIPPPAGPTISAPAT